MKSTGFLALLKEGLFSLATDNLVSMNSEYVIDSIVPRPGDIVYCSKLVYMAQTSQRHTSITTYASYDCLKKDHTNGDMFSYFLGIVLSAKNKNSFTVFGQGEVFHSNMLIRCQSYY